MAMNKNRERRGASASRRSRQLRSPALAGVLLVLSGVGQAAGPCAPALARVVSVEGSVELRRAGAGWEAADRHSILCAGDSVRVQRRSRAALVLTNETTLRLDQGTELTLPGAGENKPMLLEQGSGGVHVLTRTPKPFSVKTPFVNANVEGTEFAVSVADQSASIVVHEGHVVAANSSGSTTLASGEAATAARDEAPRRGVPVRAADAATWTLHFPTIFDYRIASRSGAAAGQPAWQRSIDRYRGGQVVEALQALEEGPAGSSAQWLTYHASLLLLVGRMDVAGPEIERALQIEPGNSDAHALLAIVAVVRNDKDEGLARARKAVELDPASPAALVSLSYAQQAQFRIDDALASVRQATALDAGNALLWARLAELEMSTGRLGAALTAAQRAVALDPNVARTQSVLGFAHLAQLNVETAKASFDQAIDRDQGDPLPWLGLGLARIREGEIAAGRSDLEVAAVLDPQNSLVRSYLGKAYQEEQRSGLAGDQFRLAVQRDPADPTPHFYEALRLQAEGQPVGALGDLDQSIRLNDNRAAYRSRLLLDQDLAVRSISLARIYDSLGFERLGLAEASASMLYDPANFSSHAFLSDVYGRLPRHEIARVSEALQGQLLASGSANPVQPSLLIAGSALWSDFFQGAASGGRVALFERESYRLTTAAVLGNEGKRGAEAILSGVRGAFSYSLGTLRLDSDGYRPNNDLHHEAQDAFVQFAVTPALSLQFELRSERLANGDLTLDFDPDTFRSDRRHLKQQSARLGMHLSDSPASHWLASASRLRWREDQNIFFNDEGGNTHTLDTNVENRGYQAELQYLHRAGLGTVVGGAGSARIDGHDGFGFDGAPGPFSDGKIRQDNLYVYANLLPEGPVSVTLGLSYDAHEELAFKVARFNPKFGLRWQAGEALSIRAAAFSTVNRTITGSQSIEPTQVAGFNQFFDDTNGTRTSRYGVAADYRASDSVRVGGEISARDVWRPQILGDTGEMVIYEKQREKTANAYMYWTASRQLVATAGAEWDDFGRTPNVNVGPTPLALTTLVLPFSARYFTSGGTSLRVGVNAVRQRVERLPAFAANAGKDSFATVDGEITFRLPNGKGSFALQGRNLGGTKFHYVDESFRKLTPELPRFSPARSVFASVSLAL